MRKEILITKLLIASRGERPRLPCGTAHEIKQTGEANRALPASHKSAEPVDSRAGGNFRFRERPGMRVHHGEGNRIDG